MALLWIIEDERDIRWDLKRKLKPDGYQFFEVSSGEEALRSIKEKIPDLVLLDLCLPGMNGFEVMQQLLEQEKNLPVLVITGSDDVKTAVQAMKQGATDYLVKPVEEEELRLIVRRSLENQRLRRELEHIRESTLPPHELIGSSQKMKRLRDFIKNIAGRDVSVLIQGESGTGKQIVAEMLHRFSPRQNASFVTVDCGAFPETLMESEFFGYEKGAFTGAATRKPGKLEIAKGGTLFLDEIGNLSWNLQAKFLRVLETGQFERVGGTAVLHADFRLLCATNANLEEMIRKGQFRSDLYYRINVIKIEVPPLREHLEDIEELAHYFLQYFKLKHQATVQSISSECLQKFRQYHWPGNVRQLRNIMEHAVLMAGEEIQMQHLPVDFPSSSRVKETAKEMKEIGNLHLETLEEQSLRKALARHQGNRRQTARELGISLRTLYYWLKRYNIQTHR